MTSSMYVKTNKNILDITQANIRFCFRYYFVFVIIFSLLIHVIPSGVKRRINSQQRIPECLLYFDSVLWQHAADKTKKED